MIVDRYLLNPTMCHTNMTDRESPTGFCLLGLEELCRCHSMVSPFIGSCPRGPRLPEDLRNKRSMWLIFVSRFQSPRAESRCGPGSYASLEPQAVLNACLSLPRVHTKGLGGFKDEMM